MESRRPPPPLWTTLPRRIWQRAVDGTMLSLVFLAWLLFPDMED